MPQITTRGRKPGIKLTQGERTRWQAVIDDLRVVAKNESDEEAASEATLTAEGIETILERYSPPEKEEAPVPEPKQDRKAG